VRVLTSNFHISRTTAAPLEISVLCQTLHAGGAEKQLLLCVKALCELGAHCAIRTIGPSEPVGPIKSLSDELATRHHVYPRKLQWTELLSRRSKTHVWWAWGRRADLLLKTLKPVFGGRLFCSIRDADRHNMERYCLLERAFQRRVDCFISNTSLACRELSRIVPEIKNRSTVLLNALPERKWGLKLPAFAGVPPFRIAMLGNILIKKKGYDVLLSVAELLRERGERIIINVVGRDDSGGKFQALVAEKQLSEWIKYHGPEDNPLEFLSQNHAFLLLSRYEGTPNALLEAMSVGLPCISTRVGDLSEQFRSGEHLELIPVCDAELAVSAILRLRAHPEYAERLGRAGRARCEALFSFEELKKNLRAIFWKYQLP
jgi:glycosyltransferase involved in cell wall biosynthesis